MGAQRAHPTPQWLADPSAHSTKLSDDRSGGLLNTGKLNERTAKRETHAPTTPQNDDAMLDVYHTSNQRHNAKPVDFIT